MALARLVISAGCMLLPGCAKVEPLDEPIDARTMNHFLRWQKRHVLPLGDPIVGDFAEALSIIGRKTAGYKQPSTDAEYRSPFNPLCQQLDGRRLRDVILEGYDLLNAAMRDRIFIDRLNIDKLHVRMNDEGVDLSSIISRQEAMIAHWEDRVRRNEARMRELKDSPP